MKKGAQFSECRTWRYALWRRWAPEKTVAFIGLNPSTADETQDDPTVRRCIDFARRWGYGGMFMLNIFAFRATDPREMKAAFDPVGPENDDYLLTHCRLVDLRILCWGTHGAYRERGYTVHRLLTMHGLTRHCFGKTKAGHPKHPLYLAKKTNLIELGAT